MFIFSPSVFAPFHPLVLLSIRILFSHSVIVLSVLRISFFLVLQFSSSFVAIALKSRVQPSVESAVLRRHRFRGVHNGMLGHDRFLLVATVMPMRLDGLVLQTIVGLQLLVDGSMACFAGCGTLVSGVKAGAMEEGMDSMRGLLRARSILQDLVVGCVRHTRNRPETVQEQTSVPRSDSWDCFQYPDSGISLKRLHLELRIIPQVATTPDGQ